NSIISNAAIESWRRRALAPQGKRAGGGSAPNQIARGTHAVPISVLISEFLSPPPQVFSRAACGKAVIDQTNSQAHTPDQLSVVFDRARRRYAPTQSQNARPLVASDRLHQDNQKRGAIARTIPARGDRARCKSRSARQNMRQSACADNCCEFRRM